MRKPQDALAERLTKVFGTADWEKSFYSSRKFRPLFTETPVEEDHKSVDHREIIDFFMARLRKEFEAVADPKPLHNSRTLLFMLIFAAGNAASAKTGIKIANSTKF
jgi:hypothetical protein